jgi:hypothetical protein
VKSSRSESFVLYRSKISVNFCFNSMDLGMFDRFYPSLKTRVLIVTGESSCGQRIPSWSLNS